MQQTATTRRAVEDAAWRAVDVPDPPQRLIALSPPLAALVADVGAGARLVGWAGPRRAPAIPGAVWVGPTHHLDLERLMALAPDLVLADAVATPAGVIALLAAAGLTVYAAGARTVEESVGAIGEIGEIVGGDDATVETLVATARAGVRRARQRALATGRRVRVFCPARREPWVALGVGSYLHDALWTVGARPLLAGDPTRLRQQVTRDQIGAAQPEAILLATTLWGFTADDVAELSALAPTALIEGRALTWLGGPTAQLDQVAELIARLVGA